jgi:hypothetical protein
MPDAWFKLLSEDKKRVIEGRAKSAEQQFQTQGRGGGASKNIAAVSAEADNATIGATMIQSNMDNAVLQGALQGSAAVSEKRTNTETAGLQLSRRRMNKVVSSLRSKQPNVSKMSFQQHHSLDSTITGYCELDLHADTSVAGSNCVVMEVTEQTVNLSAFADVHGVMKNIPIVTAATAFDDENTGDTYILILGQCIYIWVTTCPILSSAQISSGQMELLLTIVHVTLHLPIDHVHIQFILQMTTLLSHYP